MPARVKVAATIDGDAGRRGELEIGRGGVVVHRGPVVDDEVIGPRRGRGRDGQRKRRPCTAMVRVPASTTVPPVVGIGAGQGEGGAATLDEADEAGGRGDDRRIGDERVDGDRVGRRRADVAHDEIDRSRGGGGAGGVSTPRVAVVPMVLAAATASALRRRPPCSS